MLTKHTYFSAAECGMKLVDRGFAQSMFCAALLIIATVSFLPLTASSQNSQSAVEKSKFILVLYDNNRLLPANIDADRALNASPSTSEIKNSVSAEFLDSSRFRGGRVWGENAPGGRAVFHVELPLASSVASSAMVDA